MAISAREVVFYIRAENTASRAFKQVARDVGGLRNLKNVQAAASKANATAQAKIAKAEKDIVKNREAYNRALKESAILQKRADTALLPKNSVAVKSVQQRIAANEAALLNAQAAAAKAGRIAGTGKPSGGFTAAENIDRAKAAQITVDRLNRQTGILNRTLKETRLSAQLAYDAVQAGAVDAAAAVTALLEKEALLVKELEDVRLAAAAQAAQFKRLEAAIPLERLGRLASLAQRVGRVFQVTGIIVGATFAAMAHSAATFETQTSLAATQARKIGDPISSTAKISGKINTQILKQMQQFPATSQDMADSFYQIFSGTNVQNVDKASKMLRVFNQMAVAGSTDLKTMTDAGISLYNNFPHEFKNMTEAANAFFAAVRYARTTPAQFANSLTNVLPAAKAAGLAFTDVADAMALLTRQSGGRATSRDATGLMRLIQMFSNKDFIAGLEKSHVQVKQLDGSMRPLLDIIGDINTKFIKTGKLKPGPDIINFFKQITALGSGKAGTQGTAQGNRSFQYLLLNSASYHKVAKQVNNDNDEMIKSFAAQSKTPQVKWSVFVNQMRTLAITLGEAAIPAIVELGKVIVPLLHGFEHLSPHTKHLIATFAVIGSVGAVAVGTILSMAGAVAHLYIAYKLMRASGGLLAALGFGGEAGAVGIKLSIIAGFVALAVVLVKYPNIIRDVTNAFGGLKNTMMVLAGIIGIFTLAKVTAGMALVTSEATVAGVAVSKLRLGLLGLALIGTIVIPIVEKVSQIFESKKAKPGDTTSNYSGGITGLFQKASQVANYGVARAMGESPKNAKAFAEWANKNGFSIVPTPTSVYHPAASKWKQLQSIIGNSQLNDKQLEAAQKAFSGQDWKTLYAIYAKGQKLMDKQHMGAQKSLRELNPRQYITPVVAALRQVDANKELMNSLNKVAKLQQLATAAPKNKAAHDAYFKALAAINLKYADKMTQDYISNYLSSVESADKKSQTKRLSAAQKAAKAYASQLSNAYSNIMSTYNTFLQQNQANFGQLFSGPYMQSPLMQARMSFNNQGPRPQDLLKDIHSQLFQFNRFNSVIGRLKRKGAPQALVDQLNAAGPSALKDVQALNRLSPAAYRNYVATFNKAQTAIKKNTMAQLNNQLSIYKKFGSKVALAIIAGIKGEDPKLQNQLEKTINQMFPNLVKEAAKAPKTVSPGSKQNLAPHVTHHHDNRKVEIHNPKTNSIATSVAQAFFQMKVKKH